MNNRPEIDRYVLTEEQTKEATLVVLAMRTGYELGKAEGKQTA